MGKNNIVHIQLDNWYDMKDATQYLKKLENGDYDDEINYSEVWYDMAIVYCITTTESYIKKYPELRQHVLSKAYMDSSVFKPYFPNYEPANFGKKFYGEYEGWAPYKDFKENNENNESLMKEKCV